MSRSSHKERVLRIVSLLRSGTKNMAKPAACEVVRLYGKNPFLVLISCLLSLRTKDTVSLPASIRLFSLAQTPKSFLFLDRSLIEKLIYPVGFYRQKAQQIHALCAQLLEHYQGTVPTTKEGLLLLDGVGPKTANLVLGQGFGIPAICVDTHVHRISNRLGLVTTQTPEETERELSKIVPKQYWIELNTLLVMWGQNQCTPLSPWCSSCPLKGLCPQEGVKKNR